MPGPKLPDMRSDAVLPKRVDVVVIGAGVIGAATALELAERGLKVLLCDKGQVGGEQSSRNWGWVRLGLRDPREIPLMQVALDLWPDLSARVGQDLGYRRSGILFATPGRGAQRRHQAWADGAGLGPDQARLVQGAALDALMPGHRMRLAAGLYLPGDGRAEPQRVAPALAQAARARGAHLVTGCAVRSLDLAAGRVAGVITERGRVACDRVVLAAGAWSRLFAGNAGVALPQLKVLNSVLRSSAVPEVPDCALWSDGFAIRRRADGGFTIASGTENTVDLVPDSFRLAWAFLPAFRAEWRSLRFRLSARWRIEAAQRRRWTPDQPTPFEAIRVLDPTPSQAALNRAWAAAQAAFPALAQAQVVQSWGGLIDVTPDALPVISDVPQLPGLFLSTGYSGHGFGISPGAGRLTADLVTGAPPVVDPSPFRLQRFQDGSRITVFSGH